MIYTLLFSLATFTLVYVTLLRQRTRLEKAKDQLATLRLQHDQAGQSEL
jgi:hypothetical protein